MSDTHSKKRKQHVQEPTELIIADKAIEALSIRVDNAKSVEDEAIIAFEEAESKADSSGVRLDVASQSTLQIKRTLEKYSQKVKRLRGKKEKAKETVLKAKKVITKVKLKLVNLTKKIPTYVTKLAEAEGECLRAEGLVNDLISEYKINVRLKDTAAANLKLATRVLNEAVTDLLTAKSKQSEVDVDTLVGACKVNIIELNEDIAKLEKELAQKKERLRKDTAELGDLED